MQHIIDTGLDRSLFLDSTVANDSRRGGAWAKISVRAPSAQNGSFVFAHWQGVLAGSALAELASKSPRGDLRIRGVQVEARDPGDALIDGRGAGFPERLVDLPGSTDVLSDSRIADIVGATVSRQGWTLVSTRVLHPNRPAVAVVIRIPDGHAKDFEDFGNLIRSIRSLDLGRGECVLQGAYLKVLGAEDQTLAVTAGDCVAHSGSTWTSADGPIHNPRSNPPPSTGQQKTRAATTTVHGGPGGFQDSTHQTPVQTTG